MKTLLLLLNKNNMWYIFSFILSENSKEYKILVRYAYYIHINLGITLEFIIIVFTFKIKNAF